jgi:pimeloyl-ACP methyl ester carboxylesterase
LVSTIQPDNFGFIASRVDGSAGCASFRGTRQLDEWLEDADFIPTDFLYGPGIVHSGFQEAYEKVRQSAMSGVASLSKAAELWVVGHSLGGALAQLLAAELTRARTWTFASPRAGKASFAGQFANREVWRIANDLDVVPHQPNTFLGYADVGSTVLVHHSPTPEDVAKLSGHHAAWLSAVHSLEISYLPGLLAWGGAPTPGA